MPLINQVKQICDRLALAGWRNLFLQHGLDITARDLKTELTKELTNIDRSVPGFEDFAFEGTRGIEPGLPARSLLYHGFASTNVVKGADGLDLREFPTLAEIEAIENYVFGIEPPSLSDLSNRGRGQLMAIVVFASEYRPASETVHRKYADMCFSRTGVARVGTAAPVYDARNRGFVPFVEGDDFAFAVLGSRYSAYIAVQLQGNENVFGPMNFRNDQNREFWVPLHKLFDGDECIRGLNLNVSLEANHVNEKLRRLHLELQKKGLDTGWSEPDISQPPFIFSEGIAEWSRNPEHGKGMLMPVVHNNLIEAARYQNKPLTFKVPPNPENGFSPSLLIQSNGPSRPAPEYVHVRHQVQPDGTIVDLNNLPDVAQKVRQGGYDAQHYLDFTGDGWIDAVVPELATAFPRQVPAYSLVTAPDFYPNCDQRELLEWWQQRVPTSLRDSIWSQPPLTLSDERLAPNLQLEGADFRAEDTTATAIISLPSSGSARQMPLGNAQTMRHNYLPDAAAGVFAPGWDTSVDNTDDTNHLAAYGLGSPFPEDAKLCAALSAFWPAVAPDAGRSFSRNFATVSPMTDAEIIDLPWDGVVGPSVVIRNNQQLVEYTRFDHVDYIENSLNKKFSLSLTGKVDVNEYTNRVIAMTRAYRAAGIGDREKRAWGILSFRDVEREERELEVAMKQTGTRLQGNVYRFEFYRRGREIQHDSDFRKVYVEILETVVTFVGAPPRILVQRNNGGFQAVRTA